MKDNDSKTIDKIDKINTNIQNALPIHITSNNNDKQINTKNSQTRINQTAEQIMQSIIEFNKSNQNQQIQQNQSNQLADASCTSNNIENCLNQLDSEILIVQQNIQSLDDLQLNLQQLSSNILTLNKCTPSKCAEEYEQKEELNDAFNQFRQQIQTVQNNFKVRQQFIYDVKNYFQNTFNFFSNASTSLLSLIETDQTINSNFLDKYHKQRVTIEKSYEKIKEEKGKYNQLENAIQVRKKLQSFTNEIANSQSSKSDFVQFHQEKKSLVQKKQEIYTQKGDSFQMMQELKNLNSEAYHKKQQLQSQKQIFDTQKQRIKNDGKQEELQVRNELNKVRDSITSYKNQQDQIFQSIKQFKEKTDKSIEAFSPALNKVNGIAEYLKVRPNKFMNIARIYLLNESVGMQGDIFQACTQEIRNSLNSHKISSAHDTLTLIQFDGDARKLIKRNKVQYVNPNQIGQSCNGGQQLQLGPAFNLLEESISQIDKENIIFVILFMNSQSIDSDYMNTLSRIKKNTQKILVFFVVSYGNYTDKKRLQEIDTLMNEELLNLNLEQTDRLKTFFQIGSLREIQEAFNQIAQINVQSIFTLYDKKKKQLKAQMDNIRKPDPTIQQKQKIIGDELKQLYDRRDQLQNQLGDIKNRNLETEKELQHLQNEHHSSIHEKIKSTQAQTNEEVSKLREKLSKNELQLREKEQECEYKKEVIEIIGVTASQYKKGNQLLVEQGFSNFGQYTKFKCHISATEDFEIKYQEFQNSLVLLVKRLYNTYNQLSISLQEMIDIQNKNKTSNYHIILFEAFKTHLNQTQKLELKGFDLLSIIKYFAISYYKQMNTDEDQTLNEVSQGIYRSVTFEKLASLKQQSDDDEDTNTISFYIYEVQTSICPKTSNKNEYQIKYGKQLTLISVILTQMFEALQGVKFRLKQISVAQPLKSIIVKLQQYQKIQPAIDSLKAK